MISRAASAQIMAWRVLFAGEIGAGEIRHRVGATSSSRMPVTASPLRSTKSRARWFFAGRRRIQNPLVWAPGAEPGEPGATLSEQNPRTSPSRAPRGPRCRRLASSITRPRATTLGHDHASRLLYLRPARCHVRGRPRARLDLSLPRLPAANRERLRRPGHPRKSHRLHSRARAAWSRSRSVQALDVEVRRDRPGVAANLVDRHHRRDEARICERADGDRDEAGQTVELPEHGRAARRTEAENRTAAAVPGTHELGRGARERHLFASEARPAGPRAGRGGPPAGRVRLPSLWSPSAISRTC